MQLQSQAIWAISLQRSLNSAKPTWLSPQYLHHRTKIINSALSIPPARKKQGQELGSCSWGRDGPFPEQVVMKTLSELFSTPWKQIKLTARSLQKTDEAF